MQKYIKYYLQPDLSLRGGSLPLYFMVAAASVKGETGGDIFLYGDLRVGEERAEEEHRKGRKLIEEDDRALPRHSLEGGENHV